MSPFSPCPLFHPQADFNGDGSVTIADYSLLEQNYNQNLQNVWLMADLNGDWVVDDLDADILGDHYYDANPTHADGDLNGDGDITESDIDLMFAQWGLELEVAA
jgi:hypothetical protein